jgi:hypothetical protein
VATLERENEVVFDYLNPSEIWPDKKGGLIRRGLLFCLVRQHYRRTDIQEEVHHIFSS